MKLRVNPLAESFRTDRETAVKGTVRFVEESLKKIGCDRKIVLKTMLITEELVVMLYEHAKEDAVLKVKIRRRFGDCAVILSMEGDPVDPMDAPGLDDGGLQELDDVDTESAVRSIFLKSQGEKLKFTYSKGENRVRILVGEAERSLLKMSVAALILGLLAGTLMKFVLPQGASDAIAQYALTPIRTVFMNALKLIIAPVVFFSIVSCVSQFDNIKELGRIGARVMGMYVLTSVIAILVGLGFSVLLHPGSSGFAMDTLFEMNSVSVDTDIDTSLLNTIVNIVPSNFLRPFVESDTLSIIFLAVITGLAVGMIGEYSSVIRNLFEACNSLFLTITTMITQFIPVAIFCSVALMFTQMGGDAFTSVLGLVVTQIISIMCMIVIYGVLILVLAHLNPLTFFKKNREGMLTSFTLCSSSAAMPVNMKICTDKLGISPKVCNFSIPLGATVNMDGISIFMVNSALFLARAYGIEISTSSLVAMLVTVLLLSLGAPGVPGSGLVCLGIVLSGIGVPMEGIGLVMAVTSLMDMFDTMSNTTGDVAATLIVAKKEGLVNMDVWSQK